MILFSTVTYQSQKEIIATANFKINITISNSMTYSDIWHKINTTSDISKLLNIICDNFEISRVVIMANITYKSCYY